MREPWEIKFDEYQDYQDYCREGCDIESIKPEYWFDIDLLPWEFFVGKNDEF